MLSKLAIAMVLAGFAARLAAAPVDEFEARIYTDTAGKTLPYRLMKPANYDAKQKYPVVLFFHGAGERGTDNKNQLKNAIGVLATPANRTKYPCFVIAPQCPGPMMWVDTPWSLDAHKQPEKMTEAMRMAFEILAAVQKEFSTDPARLYVAGISMGGFGTWDAAMRQPDLFAAMLPVCGGADDTKAALIAKIPVWTFHGDKDGVVKTIRSRNIIEALKNAGGTPKYTEYPGVGHDSWSKAFSDPATMEWLFAQKK